MNPSAGQILNIVNIIVNIFLKLHSPGQAPVPDVRINGLVPRAISEHSQLFGRNSEGTGEVLHVHVILADISPSSVNVILD